MFVVVGDSTGALRPGCGFRFPAFSVEPLGLAGREHLFPRLCPSQDTERRHDGQRMLPPPLATQSSGNGRARFAALKVLPRFRGCVRRRVFSVPGIRRNKKGAHGKGPVRKQMTRDSAWFKVNRQNVVKGDPT